jgi:hypothetical protein
VVVAVFPSKARDAPETPMSATAELDTGFLLPTGRSNASVESATPSVSVQEQQIIAEIQELQRQLWKIKTDTQEGGDGDGGDGETDKARIVTHPFTPLSVLCAQLMVSLPHIYIVT